MIKLLCLDMDGSIADLYSVEDWLSKLRAEDASPYRDADPLYNTASLGVALEALQMAGWTIAITTALSKGASPEYKQAIRDAKRDWLAEWEIPYDHFHGIDYTASKAEVARRYMPFGLRNVDFSLGEAVLVDDEARHRDKWGWGRTIDPSDGNLIEALYGLL